MRFLVNNSTAKADTKLMIVNSAMISKMDAFHPKKKKEVIKMPNVIMPPENLIISATLPIFVSPK